MKKLLFAIALMTLTVLAADAQQRKGRKDLSPDKMAERITEKMTEELSLNEAQQREVYDLNLQTTKERTEAMQESKEARQKMLKKMKADQEKHDQDLAEILTPDQMEKWKEYRKASMERMRDRREKDHRRQKEGL
ncbi:DUF4890 domain-containing protein [Echinicola rosea]|uniref:DUF4890 domain-containing protein n=1 Tax=Echinicola rosea TaxID=1807691 RepID=A0ABQ1V053_9BACT|nr:DUF4890 domain-containing protein [Echinicola rosea]GGF32735.1 hypothetical protein GCM10011339_21100 [Echinicola rosea]